MSICGIDIDYYLVDYLEDHTVVNLYQVSSDWEWLDFSKRRQKRYIYKWRVWCNTEGDWKYVWSFDMPTTCPSDNQHSIDKSKIVIIQQVYLCWNRIKSIITPIKFTN